eukprot:g28976.t1
MMVSADKPIQWKGGSLHMLPKGPAPTSAAQYRGIMLLGVLARRVHALFRGQVTQHAAQNRPPGQLGGFPHEECSFGNLYVNAFMRRAYHIGLPSAVIFVDLQAAFHSADLLKIDFGVHVEGHILDCAFSMSFDPMHDELMRAVQEATEEGIRQAGHDVRISHVSRCIQEVMEAAEVHRPDGKVLPVKRQAGFVSQVIKNLTGHLIGPYKIHAGKSLPSVNTGDQTRMLAGELWAVETFGSVGGFGYVGNGGNCSHFMRPSSAAPTWQSPMLSSKAISLLELIDRRFGTLAFCPRWLVQEGDRSKMKMAKGSQMWWSAPLDELCNLGVVNRYPPLADLQGSYTAQYEHTILLGSSGKEVLTRGATLSFPERGATKNVAESPVLAMTAQCWAMRRQHGRPQEAASELPWAKPCEMEKTAGAKQPKNLAGRMCFGLEDDGTTKTEVFINLVDNSARLDSLGFWPFAEVVGLGEGEVGRVERWEGGQLSDIVMAHGDIFFAGGASQAKAQVRTQVLVAGGNSYIDKTYPGLSQIIQCRRVEKEETPAKSGDT